MIGSISRRNWLLLRRIPAYRRRVARSSNPAAVAGDRDVDPINWGYPKGGWHYEAAKPWSRNGGAGGPGRRLVSGDPSPWRTTDGGCTCAPPHRNRAAGQVATAEKAIEEMKVK